MGSTVWLALVLWLVMCIGELGIVSQSVLAMYAWIALFCLPYFYRACRHALDALVEETLLFVAEVVRGGRKLSHPLGSGWGYQRLSERTISACLVLVIGPQLLTRSCTCASKMSVPYACLMQRCTGAAGMHMPWLFCLHLGGPGEK